MTVNKLWLEQTRALLASGIALTGSSIFATRVMDYTNIAPLLASRPELYRKTRRLDVSVDGRNTALIVAAFREMCQSARLREMELCIISTAAWVPCKSLVRTTLPNLTILHLRFCFSGNAKAGDEFEELSDVLASATRITSLHLIFGSDSFNPQAHLSAFGSLLKHGARGIRVLHLACRSVRAETAVQLLREVAYKFKSLERLRLDIGPGDGADISSAIPQSIRQLEVRSLTSTLHHLLLKLADPSFLPQLSQVPEMIQCSPTYNCAITREVVDDALRGLGLRKHVRDIEEKGRNLYELVHGF